MCRSQPKGRDHRDAEIRLRVGDGKQFSSPMIFTMTEKVLSIFIDESRRFQYPDDKSRFYIISMVMHNQSVDIAQLLPT